MHIFRPCYHYEIKESFDNEQFVSNFVEEINSATVLGPNTDSNPSAQASHPMTLAQITPWPEPVKPIVCWTVLKSTSRWKWGAAPLQFWRDWKRRRSSPQNILTTTPNGLLSEHDIAYTHLAVWISCVAWMHFAVCLPLQQMTSLPLAFAFFWSEF